MNFKKVPHTKKLELFSSYFQFLTFGIDGYLERLMKRSDTYIINEIGFFSVFENTLVCYHMFAQDITTYDLYLDDILNHFSINKILFPSNDLLLARCYEKYDIKEQAYNFTYEEICTSNFNMRLATSSDKEKVYKVFGEFLNYNEIVYDESDVFIYQKGNEIISLGLYENYVITNRACVAMIVNERYRKKGYGTKTLKFLVEELQRLNIDVNARCYVLNEASLHTLKKAGFKVSNMLLKIEI